MDYSGGDELEVMERTCVTNPRDSLLEHEAQELVKEELAYVGEVIPGCGIGKRRAAGRIQEHVPEYAVDIDSKVVAVQSIDKAAPVVVRQRVEVVV